MRALCEIPEKTSPNCIDTISLNNLSIVATDQILGLPTAMLPLSRSLALGSLIFLAACGPAPDPTVDLPPPNPRPQKTPGQADPSKPISIVASTTLVADVVRVVGGDRVTVNTLIGPGLDPHLYRARESDLRLLADADLVFFHGLGLEARLGTVLRQHLAKLGDAVAIAEVIPVLDFLRDGDGPSGNIDPHVWMDPDLWKLVAEPVRETLVSVDPGSATDYNRRAHEWKTRLEALKTELNTKFDDLSTPSRVLVTAHDAFRYFGRAFRFEVRGLQGVSTASEPGVADVDQLAQFLTERAIPAVFPESSVPTRGLEALRQAVEARGHRITIGEELLSDSLDEPQTPAGTYIGMMRQNAKRILEAMAPAHINATPENSQSATTETSPAATPTTSSETAIENP